MVDSGRSLTRLKVSTIPGEDEISSPLFTSRSLVSVNSWDSSFHRNLLCSVYLLAVGFTKSLYFVFYIRTGRPPYASQLFVIPSLSS